MSVLDEALAVLRAHREGARALGIELVGIVGSVARGEARPDSDVDVVYDVIGRASLLDLGGVLMDLQDDMHRKVDLVDRRMMRPERWAYMARDLVALP